VETTNSSNRRAKDKLILHLSRTHRYNIEGLTSKTVNLSLDPVPEDNKGLIDTFTFNPEQKEATLKLNGIHKEIIPALTFPIEFDQKYGDDTNSFSVYELNYQCLRNLHDELGKYERIRNLDKEAVELVLTHNKNIDLMVSSIKQLGREVIEQSEFIADEQEQQEEQEQQNKEQPEWEKDYYDVYGRKIPEQESLKFNTNKNGKQELIEQGTELLISKYRFLTLEGGKEILYYDNDKGVYSYGGEILIEKELEEIFNFNIKSADITEIKGHIMRLTYVKKEEFDADLNIHNFKNGLYNIRTGELKPHTPDYYSLNQKPFLYNPKARSKHFVKFLKEVLYLEDIPTAIDIIAYTFVKYNPHELYFILIGIGSNGKSVYTGIIINLHGRDNVSNVSLKELANDHFGLADLDGKDVNIDTEMSSNSIKDLSVLKKLTGSQPIRVQRKHQHAYDALLHAKLIFNANQLPASPDDTDAHYRREIPLSFPNQFEGANEDPDLLKKLTSEEELSGIFNLVKPALKRLVETQRVRLSQKTIAERKKKGQLIREPINSFLKEAEDPESTIDDYVLVDDLYVGYIRFCKHHKLPIQGKTNFNSEVEHSIAIKAVKRRKEINGKKLQVWKNIRQRKWLKINPNETLTPNEDVEDNIPEF
jgi:P4 family phage/plasmid primase-like protien